MENVSAFIPAPPVIIPGVAFVTMTIKALGSRFR